MTLEQARKLAREEAEKYSNSVNYSKHKWSQDWMHDWYNSKDSIGSLSLASKHGNMPDGYYEETVERLAREIMLRNTPLYKAMREKA